jgi:hypothetical protein
MTGRKQKGQAVPPLDAAASTPFFARFLEDQHGDAAEAKAAASFQTLKYPSDRDEDDVYSPVHAEAAPTKAKASSRSLKYPSDRDEIDLNIVPYGNAVEAP